jgi:hypothetical protein
MSESLPPFIKGMELCERFYREAVRPLMDRCFPGVNHSAAKIDQGSEVLGFDTAQSRDHHWGPKAILFVAKQDYDLLCTKISEVMSEKLPFTFAGYPTHFATIPTASGGVMQFADQRPISHGVSVHTIRGFFEQYLGIDPESAIEEKQWLTLSQQCLATVGCCWKIRDCISAPDIKLRAPKQRSASVLFGHVGCPQTKLPAASG